MEIESLSIEEDASRFEGLIERFAFIKERYGDQYPIVVYEPEIESQEKRLLKEFVERNNSINLFVNFKETFDFVKQLGIGFILIISSDYDEKMVKKNFEGLQNTSGRELFDFEEKSFWEGLFRDFLEEQIKCLKVKVYVFFTLLEFVIEPLDDENEEEVMVMPEVEDMAKSFRQEFCVIWYDPNPSLENKERLEEKVDIEEKNIYRDFDELCKRISEPTQLPYHLILTGKNEAEKVIQEIENLKDLLCLYIYCDDLDEFKVKNRKIMNLIKAEKNLVDLIPRLVQGIRTNSKLSHTFPAFATHFDGFDKTQNFNLHYYLQGLINFKNRRQAKRDFVGLAKKVYQSKEIFKFESDYDEYDKDKIFRWYTKESPVYKLVNNCLRIATSDSILYCRYILKDLERAIKEQYHQESKQFNGLVYRGAYITKEEWEKLEQNVGKEIEMYGFLSTSKDRQTAKKFFCSDAPNKIFITIIIPPLPKSELNQQGFADLSEISQCLNENEILFNVRSKFRILELGVTKVDFQGTQCRHLLLMYGTHLLRRFMSESTPKINIELELPSEIKCVLCGSMEQLFGFKQGEMTVVHCMKCIAGDSAPKGTILLPIERQNGDESKIISKNFNGKLLTFNTMESFSYDGYKCHTCQAIGKEKYYKWLAMNGTGALEQCLDCFKLEKLIESHTLIMEENPYSLWREDQAEWEKIYSSYQMEISRDVIHQHQIKVFVEVNRFDLCILYGENLIRKIGRKRRREFKKSLLTNDLTQVWDGLGDYQKTIRYLGKQLNILEEIYGNHSPHVALFSYNLATAYGNSGRHQESLRYFKKALDMNIEFYGESHPQTIHSYSALALFLQNENLGENQKALEYYKKALCLAKIVYGKAHPQTAALLQNFAGFYQQIGKYQQAQKYNEKALNITKSTFGEKHPRTANSYSELGSLSGKLGYFYNAMNFLGKALDIYETIHGKTHPLTAKVYMQIAEVCQLLGKHEQAFEYFQKALQIFETIFGENHLMTASSYQHIASVCGSLGKYKEELEYSQKALDITKVKYGENHPQTAVSYFSLGRAYDHFKDFQQSFQYNEKVLSIMKGVYGENHPSIAVSYCYLAFDLVNLEELPKALEFSLKAIDIGKKFFEDEHPDTARCFRILGIVFQKLGRYREALKFCSKVLDIEKSIYGEQHQNIANLCTRIAEIYRSLNNIGGALTYYEKSLEITTAISGKMHPTNALIYNSLGLLYCHLRMFQEATDCLQKAQDIIKSTGENDPSVVAGISNNLSLISKFRTQTQKTANKTILEH